MFDLLAKIYEFLIVGIYDFIVVAIGYLFAKLFLLWLEIKLWSISFAWDIAKEFLATMNLSGLINSSFSGLSQNSRAALQFFRVPEAINILMSACATRYVMKVTRLS
jgi:hypothetical protein